MTALSDLEGVLLREACTSLPNWPEPLVRSAIFHLLWTQHLTLDLTRPLSPSHVLATDTVPWWARRLRI